MQSDTREWRCTVNFRTYILSETYTTHNLRDGDANLCACPILVADRLRVLSGGLGQRQRLNQGLRYVFPAVPRRQTEQLPLGKGVHRYNDVTHTIYMNH